MPDKDDKKLIIEVDLACATCCTKIQKVLCKIKDKENIKNISYDAKKNEVTITGSFDPDKLYDKLRCKVGRCCIKGKKKEEEPKKKEEPKKEEPKVAATANATVNLQYAQVCIKCYPWPCRCQTRQQCKEVTWGVPSICNTGAGHWGGSCSCGGGGVGCCPPPPPICCPGPSGCGGCGTCRGGDRCPGPSRCRGCNGCRLRLEQKYEYLEYPHSACTVM